MIYCLQVHSDLLALKAELQQKQAELTAMKGQLQAASQ
jgi:hypothetical protein